MRTDSKRIVLLSYALLVLLGTTAVANQGNEGGAEDPMLASQPIPADGQTLSSGTLRLSWRPGLTAHTHDVYLGTDFNVVHDADFRNSLGTLISLNQDANSLSIQDMVEVGETYYWRVDGVAAAPDYTIFKGAVWSFTLENTSPSQVITRIAATASSSHVPEMGPEKTIDGSGLDGDQHSGKATDMWLSAANDRSPWIQYAFDQTYSLQEMRVWNSNQLIEPFLGFGAKTVTIETSMDGNSWVPLSETLEFTQAPGANKYTYNTIVPFGGKLAKYVRLSIDDNWGLTSQSGLSEVQFIAIRAHSDKPVEGIVRVLATASSSFDDNMGPENTINRSGLNAMDQHSNIATDMWLSAVEDTDPWIQFEFDQPYDLHEMLVWNSNQVIEPFVGFGLKEVTIETSSDGSTWTGLDNVPEFARASGKPDYTYNTVVAFNGVSAQYVRLTIQRGWGAMPQFGLSEVRFHTLTKPSYTIIDDFEIYEDREFREIWGTWIDGYTNEENGAVVGNTNEAEKVVVYEGLQSMPIHYDNSHASYSAASRTFEPPLDWTAEEPNSLSFQMHGKTEEVDGGRRLVDSVNDPAPMYVIVTDALGQEKMVKHPYHGVTRFTEWEVWHIPLGDLSSLSLSHIKSITIGIGDPAGSPSGAKGTVYIDLLRVGEAVDDPTGKSKPSRAR